MKKQDYEQLTLFREDSPASPFPWLESKKEKRTTVTYGRRCSELSENLRRVGLWVRTYLESCELPGDGWSRTWSVKDITSRCLLLKLRLSEPRTGGKESHLWPNVTARDYKGSNSLEHLTRESGNRNHKDQLANAVKMFPTPTRFVADCADLKGKEYAEGSRHAMKLIQAAKLWPTPVASDKNGTHGGNMHGNLRTALHEAGETGGQLNPMWVEWLMGYPIGWTELNASETR